MNNDQKDKYTELRRWELSGNIIAFTTTRHGGYSRGEYGDMNINPWVGDEPEAVMKNRQLLCQTLGLPDTDHIIMPHQVHGTALYQVNGAFLSLQEDTQTAELEGIDIVMTDVPGVCIGVSTADCVPVLLYDAAHHASCAIHAGWRGCVRRAIPKAITAMSETYGTRPEELRALIGPHISKLRYPVGVEVIETFRKAGFDVNRFTMTTGDWDTPDRNVSEKDRRWYLDLLTFCQIELTDAGIGGNHIVDAGECTFSQPDDYFSARRQGITCGRLFTGIILKVGDYSL